MSKEERQVLSEFIELYKDQPCLWNLSCEEYKNQDQKTVAWEILASKLKTIEPNANVASAKQKIENLKSSYKRELKKVKDSKKRTGSGTHEVHKPTLWFYDLMQFLERKNEHSRWGINTLSSDDESKVNKVDKVVKKRGHSLLERNKRKLIIETAQNLLQQNIKKTNSFGVYVGEQLDSLSTHQRQIAEKLISDVIFLGKTDNLNFYSRVESHNRQCSSPTHCSARFPSPQYITPSPQYNTPSSQYNTPSPQYNTLSPDYNTLSPQSCTLPPQHDTPSPQPHYNTPVPQNVSLSDSSQINVLPLSSPHIQTQHAMQSIQDSSLSQPHIQTQPSVQSLQYSSLSRHQTKPEAIESPSSPQHQARQIESHCLPSQHQTKPTETPKIVQISIPSPVPQTVQPDEAISQNTMKAPAGKLLMELLLTSKSHLD